MSNSKNDLIKHLAQKAYDYHCKAEIYRKNGELEGALINYLLSTNNLSLVKKFKEESAEFNDLFQTKLNCKFDDNIKNALKKNIKWIVPLQTELRKIKKTRSNDENELDDEIECSDVKMTILNKGDCLTFNDIAGQETAKKQIKRGILYPILNPRLYPISSKGILFYGPPGTGKTLLAKAFVNELQLEANKKNKDIRILFYAPTGASLKGKYVGETEKNISKYFKCASKQAKNCEEELKKSNNQYYMQKLDKDGSPLTFINNDGKTEPIMEVVIDKTKNNIERRTIAVLFIDEIEAIAGSRGDDESGMMTNSVNTLLQMMDGVSSFDNVIVMAATNYPWKLDDAILRRFDTKILVSLPNEDDIVKLLKIQISMYIEKAIKIQLKKKKIIKQSFCNNLNNGNCNQQSPGTKITKKLLSKYKDDLVKNRDNEEIKNFLEREIAKLEILNNASKKHTLNDSNVNISTYGYPYNTKMPITDNKINSNFNSETHIVNDLFSGNITPSVCCGSKNPSEKICLNFPCQAISKNPKPIDKFEYYRTNYFPQLKESDLKLIAKKYADPEKPFSGGDVANACKAVFRKMANEALNLNKWYPKFIENPNLILNNKTNLIKNSTQIKEEDAYQKNEYGKKFQYLIYSPYGDGKNYRNNVDETYLFMPTSSYFKNLSNTHLDFKKRYIKPSIKDCNLKKYISKKVLTSEFDNPIILNNLIWSQNNGSKIWKLFIVKDITNNFGKVKKVNIGDKVNHTVGFGTRKSNYRAKIINLNPFKIQYLSNKTFFEPVTYSNNILNKIFLRI